MTSATKFSIDLLIKVFLAVFFIGVAIPGVTQDPFFQQYFLLKKSESVQVNNIFQDKNAIIWFGTNKGLFEFDGIHYKRFTTTDGLPDDNVTAISQDSIGRIWVGHKNGTIAFIENRKVTKFNPDEGQAAAEVSDIIFDKEGVLWFSTLNDGMYYYYKERLYRVDDTEGLPDLFVYDITEDDEGNIWAGTDGGAAICSRSGNKLTISVLNSAAGAPDDIIKKIRISDDGNVWMATEDVGITRFSPAEKKFTPMLSSSWIYGTVTDFIIDQNEVWICSNENGMIVFNQQTNQTKVYHPNEASFNTAGELLRDQEGNIWIGSKTGVLRTHGDEIEFVQVNSTVEDDNVLALTTDKTGMIWYATHEGLFTYKKDATGKVNVQQQLVHSPFQKSVIISLYEDEAGYIWAGLFGEGLLRINPETGKVRQLNRELRNGNILNITGKGNVVWLATLGGGTRITFNGDDLAIDNYGTEQGLSSDYIYQVFVDSKNRVWFATDGKGVDLLDGAAFKHFKDGLPSGVVYGLAEDKTGMIWANVQGNGLYYLDGARFKPLPSQLKVRDLNITSLASDDKGVLVAIHESGIDLIDPKENRIRYLGEEAGLRDKKPNLNTTSKDHFGRIFFGTENGIVSYSSINNNSFQSPKAIFRELKIFDKPVNFSDDLSFDHDQDNFTISYQGVWFQNPENLNYRYRMDNYDIDWIHTRNNDVTYSKLPPGVYKFHLQVTDSDNFDHADEATFQFVIYPPFWKTIPFYFVCGVLFIIAGYTFLRYRERRLQRYKQILEAKVEARTQEIQMKNREIQAQNDEILTQNEEIQAQAEEIIGINENLEQLVRDRTEEVLKKSKALEEYAFINAHKLRAPVASVLGLINLMEKTELTPEAKEINEHLKQSAEKLDSIVYTITKAIEKGIDGNQLYIEPSSNEEEASNQ